MNSREFSNRLNNDSQIAFSSFESVKGQYQTLKGAINSGADVNKQLEKMDQKMCVLASAMNSLKRTNEIANSPRFNRAPYLHWKTILLNKF